MKVCVIMLRFCSEQVRRMDLQKEGIVDGHENSRSQIGSQCVMCMEIDETRENF